MESVLVVRRSIHIKAAPERVWQEFESFERMDRWWGVLLGTPEAGKPLGQRLRAYEPRAGGRIEMEVMFDGEPARYGGEIRVFDPGREFTFENDWIPNRGWLEPTFITIRLTPALGGTLVELMHHGFERVGPDAAEQHAGYEGGWGMTQLNALRQIVEEA
ncbi:MAG: SRPBCC domain-containing protein [Dehalococcoidia bacterium]